MRRRRAGLTIVEILVAIAILAIVSASVAGVFASISGIQRDASAEQQQTIAVKAFFEEAQRGVLDGTSLPAAPVGCTGPTVTSINGGSAQRVAVDCSVLGSVSIIVEAR